MLGILSLDTEKSTLLHFYGVIAGFSGDPNLNVDDLYHV
jgi:hypothetical protein